MGPAIRAYLRGNRTPDTHVAPAPQAIALAGAVLGALGSVSGWRGLLVVAAFPGSSTSDLARLTRNEVKHRDLAALNRAGLVDRVTYRKVTPHLHPPVPKVKASFASIGSKRTRVYLYRPSVLGWHILDSLFGPGVDAVVDHVACDPLVSSGLKGLAAMRGEEADAAGLPSSQAHPPLSPEEPSVDDPLLPM